MDPTKNPMPILPFAVTADPTLFVVTIKTASIYKVESRESLDTVSLTGEV
jgi:hypothetical protein